MINNFKIKNNNKSYITNEITFFLKEYENDMKN